VFPASPPATEHHNMEITAADASSNSKEKPNILSRRRSSAANIHEQSTAREKMERLGMKQVSWTGKCDSDQVSMGQYAVAEGEGGMYGLVFDNTNSKSFSKTVTFVLMTYPTSAPPSSGHHPRFPINLSRKTSGSTVASAKTSPQLHPVDDSLESLPAVHHPHRFTLSAQPKLGVPLEKTTSADPAFYTGVLNKKRRKKAQGWARRFFSLDFATGTLSYYKNSRSSALRGAIPLALAVIGANRESRQISIDSGAEIWHLRAVDAKDFQGWHDVLQRAAQDVSSGAVTPAVHGHTRSPSYRRPMDDTQWEAVETLVGRVSGITDSVRRLTKDTSPKSDRDYQATGGPSDGNVPSQLEETAGSRRVFWRRTNSNSGQSPNRSAFRRSVAGIPTTRKVSTPTLAIPSAGIPDRKPRSQTVNTLWAPQEEQVVHDRCMEVLRDLDAVVAQFSALIAESRQRRSVEAPRRESLESIRSQEFFDAEDGSAGDGIINIDKDSDAEPTPDQEDPNESETDSASEPDDHFQPSPVTGLASPYPSKPKSLFPLPAEHVRRRITIPPSAGHPPSLISFLRKNVGKDLSTIAMPVASNEPLSLLERQAEALEYSSLLDEAASPSTTDPADRLLHIAAFAISPLSANRVKERAIRKPFNPMLGETFELIREDRGYRFLAEKISHRPVRIACQADAKSWTFLHAPLPTQKFWGKSAELITEGRARVVLHTTGEVYSWQPATCFLRNIIAGEKYVEPTQTMTVVNETTGMKAVVTFKAGGMFSGRSEEVGVAVFDASGAPAPQSMHGTWTKSLTLSSGKTIWEAGPLVHNAPLHYGMTLFAAELNEITRLEEGVLPATDSRLRPDQRAYEEGDGEKAEGLKARLEEGQRRRRKEMEGCGEVWRARWFERVGSEEAEVGKEGEEVWRLREDGGGYWADRQAVVEGRGKWDVKEVFQV